MNHQKDGIVAAAYGDTTGTAFLYDLHNWYYDAPEDIEDEMAFRGVMLLLMKRYNIDLVDGNEEDGQEHDQDFWVGEVLNEAMYDGVPSDAIDQYFPEFTP